MRGERQTQLKQNLASNNTQSHKTCYIYCYTCQEKKQLQTFIILKLITLSLLSLILITLSF